VEDIPILGAPWYLYSDETGDKDPEQRCKCFGFGIIAIPGSKNHFSDQENKLKISLGRRATEKDIVITKQLLAKHNGFVNITYFDFSDEDVVKAQSLNYETKTKLSTLKPKDLPCRANFTWVVAFGLSIADTIFDLLERGERINTVYVKYHNYSLKPRERKFAEKYTIKLVQEKVRDVCNKTNQYAERDYLKGNEIKLIDISELSDDHLQIKICDQLAGVFGRFYKKNMVNKFRNIFEKSQISISDKTKMFKNWK